MPPCSTTDVDVTVIVPARNEERFVEAALASVTAQTWPIERMEVVVVNNGSSDATGQIVETFAAEQPGSAIRVVDEPVAGVARAKNRGAALARGRWLIFMDADSRMAPDLVERVVARGRRGHPVGAIRVVADSSDPIDRAFFGLVEWGKRFFDIPAQMLYCERHTFMQVGGFDEALTLAEDREFFVRLRRDGIPICLLTESWIATSTRRLHARRWRLGMVEMLARWALANWGIGRRWRY